jgi:uncharacterized damage-inducible protein DinB
MNADAFRQFYNYHFAENRKVWNIAVTLSDAQFTQPSGYSVGSVCKQILHLISVDEGWFGDLTGIRMPNWMSAPDFSDRDAIRAHWDTVEQMMRTYLATLQDSMLLQKPFNEGEDKDLILWQVLLHVGNHGTDHRAQLLMLLNDLGVKTGPQDFVFYAYEQV